MKRSLNIELIARLSLSFMWLFTAITSFWWARSIGYEVLAQQHISGVFADLCINAGSLLDAIIATWLLSNYQLRWCYRIQIVLILVYSILISIIAPSFWLHPFGPVTKNIPILVLIFWLNNSNTPTK